MYDPTNTGVGTATMTLSNNMMGGTSVSGSFTAPDGTSLPLNTADYGSNYQVEASSSTPITIDASDPMAKSLIDEYCNTKNTDAACTFTPSSRTASTQMNLPAQGYTRPGGDNTPGTVSVTSGYNSSTSDSWSVTLTAQMELADVFSEGVSATYSQSVTWQNTFTAGDSIPVDPGYTGYIWGKVPVINYAGTMALKLGNTTYNIQNAALSSPDPTRTLSDFYAGTWQGSDPLNSPSTPPATTAPLN